jgi:hypothetical protein
MSALQVWYLDHQQHHLIIHWKLSTRPSEPKALGWGSVPDNPPGNSDTLKMSLWAPPTCSNFSPPPLCSPTQHLLSQQAHYQSFPKKQHEAGMSPFCAVSECAPAPKAETVLEPLGTSQVTQVSQPWITSQSLDDRHHHCVFTHIQFLHHDVYWARAAHLCKRSLQPTFYLEPRTMSWARWTELQLDNWFNLLRPFTFV